MKQIDEHGGIRPRFELACSTSRETLVAGARDKLRSQTCPLEGEALDDHMRVTLPAMERKAWTPVLDIRLEEVSGQVHLRCTYGPAPGAWTAFMALYIGAAFFAFTGLMYGSSQLTLGQSPWAFWALPAAALVILLLHLIARRGQKATRPQMDKLRGCLTELIHSVEDEQR